MEEDWRSGLGKGCNHMLEGVTPRKRDRAAYMRSYRAATKAVERDGDGLLRSRRRTSGLCAEKRARSRLRRCRSPGEWEKLVVRRAGCAESDAWRSDV